MWSPTSSEVVSDDDSQAEWRTQWCGGSRGGRGMQLPPDMQHATGPAVTEFPGCLYVCSGTLCADYAKSHCKQVDHVRLVLN